MPQILGIDLETYSPVPLPKTGVYRYVDTPEFQILLAKNGCWKNSGVLAKFMRRQRRVCSMCRKRRS